MNTARIQAMLVTDLDGTLLGSGGRLSPVDREALMALEAFGVARVVATGRSLYSLQQAVGNDLPVDYVVFSMGSGIITYPEARLIRKVDMIPQEVSGAVEIFMGLELDFMLHQPVPDNHCFRYHATGRDNPDFYRRLQRYEKFARPLEHLPHVWGPASQLLAVVNHDTINAVMPVLRQQLAGYSVIRSTSPLDGVSAWVEVFARGVSKSQSVGWLAERLHVRRDHIVAVGNDYNDLDLLEWAGTGYLVDNAPAVLKSRFPSVASHDHGGVAEAVHRWLISHFI